MDFQKVFQYTRDLSVLYVEDDEQLLNETSDILRDFFKIVKTAVNGQEALDNYKEYFKVNSTYYDLIITDINMPIMDGMKLIKEIHDISLEQNIIVVSAYNESSRLIDLIHIGINNFIMKPIIPKQFMDMLYKTSKQISNQNNLTKYRQELEDMNKNLDEKVKAQAKEIVFTQQISVEAIANMVESYDDTGTHLKRIENYTKLLLDKLSSVQDCPAELKNAIPFASLLHDIGKLMVPKHILTKPDKLDINEFEIIKTHARLGGEVLKKANLSFKNHFDKDSYLKIASDIAMSHHEKWDGSGYPDGLSGDEIPMCARIVAIADVYDALRSKRVYKDGFTHKKSVEIIKAEKAKSFDPKLVDIFLELNKQFEEIFNKLS